MYKSYLLLLLLLLLLCLTPPSTHYWDEFGKYILMQTVDGHEEIYTYNMVCSGCCSIVFYCLQSPKIQRPYIFMWPASCSMHSFDSVCEFCVQYICAYCVVCVCFQFLVVTIISFLLQVTIGVIAFIYREEVSYLQ